MERRAPGRGGDEAVNRYPPLEQVLPHRAPMILLDRIEDSAEGMAVCSVTLRSDSPFVEQGSVPAVVATEYMAQCVAVYAGLKARRRGEGVRVGYLIGARSIEMAVDAFHVGDRLLVTARHVWGDDALGKFECRVAAEGRRVARATLSVFQGDLDQVEVGRPVEP